MWPSLFNYLLSADVSTNTGMVSTTKQVRVWADTVLCGVWADTVLCGVWADTVLCGVWADTILCGVWAFTVLCGVWYCLLKPVCPNTYMSRVERKTDVSQMVVFPQT